MDAPDRSLFLQTLVYFSSSIQTAFQLDYHAHRFADTPEGEPSAQRRGYRRLRETWKIIDDQIGDKHWILGDQFSAADVYLFMLTTWLEPSRGHPHIHEFPNVQRIADAVMLRPSVQLVYGN
jgi:glutathione S-transferase